MTSLRRPLAVLMMASLILILLGTGCTRPGPDRSPETGHLAPQVMVTSLEEGKTITFPDHFQGQAVALSFFSPG